MFWSQLLRETSSVLAYPMFYSVHQLVAYFVCLLLGAEQVMYSEFIQAENNCLLWTKTLKCFVELKGTDESGDDDSHLSIGNIKL